MKSRNKGLLRRVARLERELGRGAIKIIPGGFGLWGAPLPPGTIVPPGARVVSDFYTNEPVKWGPNGNPTHFRTGYFCDRITTDPNDYGRDLPPLDEDTEVLLQVGCGKLVFAFDIPREEKLALHRAYLPGYTPPPDAPKPSQEIIEKILAYHHSYDIRTDSADPANRYENKTYPPLGCPDADTAFVEHTREDEEVSVYGDLLAEYKNPDGTLKKEYAELYEQPKDDQDKDDSGNK